MKINKKVFINAYKKMICDRDMRDEDWERLSPLLDEVYTDLEGNKLIDSKHIDKLTWPDGWKNNYRESVALALKEAEPEFNITKLFTE